MSKALENFYGTAKNPCAGIMKLHALVLRDSIQTEELIAFLRQRIQIEEIYCKSLCELKSKVLGNNGFANSEKVTSVVFLKYKSEMGTIANGHQLMIERLQAMVPPLEKYLSDCRSSLTPKAESIHNGWKRYEKLLADTLRLESFASKKYSELDEELKCNRDPLEQQRNVIISNRALDVDYFNDLLSELQNHVNCEDIWRILGNLKDCYNGDDLFTYLKLKGWNEIEAREFLNYLVQEGFLKACTGRAIPFSTQIFYQWKRTAMEIQNEPVYKKLKREATRAAFEANKSAKQLESVRTSIDLQMSDYIQLAIPLLLEHVKLVKSTITRCVESEKIPGNVNNYMGNELQIYLETLDPEKEIKSVIDNEKTGIKPIPTFVPKSFPPIPSRRVFGVPLTDSKRIPKIMRKCLSYLEDTFAKTPSAHLDVWNDLRKFPPEIIVAVLKQYLLELPVSLCSDELYEPLKILYLSKTDDSRSRLNSLRNMIATLPTCHFQTLTFLANYLNSLIINLDPNDIKITNLSNSLGSYILRPKVENNLTILDKHPQRLVKDLILHCHELVVSDTTPCNSPESSEDESASTRVIFLDEDNCSLRSFITKKTGYSLTIDGESCKSINE
ncbi:hypothetical protein HK103_001256 [Boothiomyces macroporosus]|uniref:Rho-GAP domain-containing protein n=1 Tax=Boothiomyces macroporosus TaxID=261099 RepID=A0AAD5Y590_9FUNG|nr:hypothetical protein HK103_001256 [Boothiomyces macroporosus]